MNTPATILPIVKHLYRRYKYDAVRRGKVFNISLEYFAGIITQPCAYCGAIEDNCYTQSQYAMFIVTYNGIDRVDNTLGYESGNCVACCKTCNRAKLMMTETEFIDWVARIHSNLAATGRLPR